MSKSLADQAEHKKSVTVCIDPYLREIADHKLNGMNYISYVDIYKNSSYHSHWHDEFEAVYVKSGSIRVFVNSSEYVLKEGDGAFINCCVKRLCLCCKYASCAAIPTKAILPKRSKIWQAVRPRSIVKSKEISKIADTLRRMVRKMKRTDNIKCNTACAFEWAYAVFYDCKFF